MDAIWVVVGDGRHVRVFRTDQAVSDLVEVHQATNNDEHAVSSRHPARGHDPHHHDAEQRFAHGFAAWLDARVAPPAFERLVIFAAPAFLGQLRKCLGPASDRIVATCACDLDKLQVHGLLPRVRELLAVHPGS